MRELEDRRQQRAAIITLLSLITVGAIDLWLVTRTDAAIAWADLGHAVMDTPAPILVMVGPWIRRRGFDRFTVAVIGGVMMPAAAVYVVVEAIERVGQHPDRPELLIAVGLLGAAIHSGAAWACFRVKRETTTTEGHHRVTDAAASIAMVVAGILELLGVPAADPVLACVVACFICSEAWTQIVKAKRMKGAVVKEDE